MTSARTGRPRGLARRGAAALAGALGLGLLGACSGGGAPFSQAAGGQHVGTRAPADLVLLWTGNVFGYIEPCGCVAGQIGGIDRLAQAVEDERAKNPELVFVDTGDLFAKDTQMDVATERQLGLKAAAFFEVWSAIGCAAMALGETDLVLGVGELAELSSTYGVPILCANLVDAGGQRPFASSVVVERAGRRIGIFSVLAPRLEEAEVESPRQIDVARLAEKQGYSLLPFREEAARVAAELAAICDLVVCASHAGQAGNEILAKMLPDVDLFIGGHWDDAKADLAFVSGTPLAISYVKGSRIGRVQWWWPTPADYFLPQGHGSLADASPWIGIDYQIELFAFEYQNLADQERRYGSQEWARRRASAQAELVGALAKRAALGPEPRGNRFAYTAEQMHSGLGRSETALAAIDRYHARVDEFWRADLHVVQRSPAFVRPEQCATCHPAQYDFWRATRHSLAFSTLEATRQSLDAECIGCHTVGYGNRDGFLTPAGSPRFENVQCAACHGPGAGHLAGTASVLDPRTLFSGDDGCFACHDKEHDPRFEQDGAARLPYVACPPMGPLRSENQALQASARAAAEAIEILGGDYGAAVEAWTGLGETGRALAIAGAWYEVSPGAPQPMAVYAQQLIGAGREDEALAILERLLRKQPNHGLGQGLLARAALARDPERALAAALEATSLQPDQGEWFELAARAYLVLGRRGEAKRLLEAVAGRFPERARALEELAALAGS
jgi:tetratricopeptide (TPR) repeat protein